MPSIFENYKKNDTDLFCWKRKENYRKSQVVTVVSYRCPMHYTCNCPSLLRALRSDSSVTIQIEHENNVKSHKDNHLKKLYGVSYSRLEKVLCLSTKLDWLSPGVTTCQPNGRVVMIASED